MPLGQFRDTFIVAVDDEGIAIIDQHVAHERILFERITERLTSGRLESQRLLEPLLVELSASGRQALLAHAADLDRLGFEVEDFGGESLRLSACPALLPREEWQRGGAGAGRGPRRARPRRRGDRRAEAHRGDDGLPCGGEGELPADAGEDGAHPRRPAADGVLDDLPARPAGHAAPDAAGAGEALREGSDMRKLIVVGHRWARVVGVALHGQAQAPRFLTPTPPAPLFFREPWRQSAPMDASTNFRPEGGVTPAAVTNPLLELKIYDPLAAERPGVPEEAAGGFDPGRLARAVVRPARRLQPEPAAGKVVAGAPTDPPNLWTGVCQTAVAVTLRHKDSFVNLTGLARASSG